jgi:hypothetical protein
MSVEDANVKLSPTLLGEKNTSQRFSKIGMHATINNEKFAKEAGIEVDGLRLDACEGLPHGNLSFD